VHHLLNIMLNVIAENFQFTIYNFQIIFNFQGPSIKRLEN